LAINGHDFSTLMHDKATTWLISGLLALGLEFISASLYLLIAALALAGGGLVWPRSSRAVRRRGAGRSFAFILLANSKRHSAGTRTGFLPRRRVGMRNGQARDCSPEKMPASLIATATC
jgi:hypothetical protein